MSVIQDVFLEKRRDVDLFNQTLRGKQNFPIVSHGKDRPYSVGILVYFKVYLKQNKIELCVIYQMKIVLRVRCTQEYSKYLNFCKTSIIMK